MRSNFNIEKRGNKIKAYKSILNGNDSSLIVWREYINFIRTSGYNKSGIEIVDICEKMLDEAGYLTVKLQNTLENVMTKALR